MASREIRLLLDVTPQELGEMLDRGWRRFGPSYFRPSCDDCQACVSVRIPVAQFRPSKSQRRARNQARRLRRTVATPIVDDERLDLYARWHAQREADRGWEASPLTPETYAFEFTFPHPSVHEVCFRDPADDNRLVGVGIVDQVPQGLSAVYFFWDPERAPSSLGTANVVGLIDDAAMLGLPYVYLGYRVEGCASLEYKSRFQPLEVMTERPADRDEPEWRSSKGR